MTEPLDPNAPTELRCPWCSTVVTSETVTCPSCGATLREEAAADIPGVTQIDPAATLRSAPRGRGLIGWLSGDYETTETDADRAGVEPPSSAVRQEMLRLEMEALRAELEAEAAAARVSAAAAGGPLPVSDAAGGLDAAGGDATPSPDDGSAGDDAAH